MATPTYDLLESVTLTTAASSVTFSSIDQSYGDLILVANLSLSVLGAYHLRLNGDSGSNYARVHMAVAASVGIDTDSVTEDKYFLTYLDAVVESLTTVQIMDYSATDKHKSILSRANTPTTTDAYTTLVKAGAGRWANTAAVTQIEILALDNFRVGSTFNLYGVAK